MLWSFKSCQLILKIIDDYDSKYVNLCRTNNQDISSFAESG
jgi:hypothetical protein